MTLSSQCLCLFVFVCLLYYIKITHIFFMRTTIVSACRPHRVRRWCTVVNKSSVSPTCCVCFDVVDENSYECIDVRVSFENNACKTMHHTCEKCLKSWIWQHCGADVAGETGVVTCPICRQSICFKFLNPSMSVVTS